MFFINTIQDLEPPTIEITNGIIKAQLLLPDAEKGYYRATRFDWSGVISNLEFEGHSYFGKWYERYNPLTNDAIMGPVEAFDPLGFDEANECDGFVKIGVGLLEKINTKPYNFATYYPIINGGSWQVKAKNDQVKFTQILKGTKYDYEYNKTVKLLKNKPWMVISHTLKNKGKNMITTSVFNHNFLVIDKQITGPGIEVTFPVADEKINTRMQDLIKMEGNKLVFLKELNRRNASFFDLTGGKGAPYNIKVENKNTGALVNISADKRISKLVFWSASKTVCPEPYIEIKLKPGASFSWKITYKFATNILKSSHN